jgi:hypothetical protein
VTSASGAVAAPAPVASGAWLDAGAFAREAVPPRRFELTLLDPGGAPRAPLRYLASAAGVRVGRRLRTTLRQSISLDGAPTTQVASPPWSMAVTMIAPAAVAAPWRYELGRIELEPPETADSAQFRTIFEAWEPVAGELAVDARGRRAPDARAVFSAHLPERANEPLKLLDDCLDAWVPVLPEEPIGVGARWRVVDELSRAGLDLQRTATFTLAGVDHGAPRIHAEVALAVPTHQRVNLVMHGEVLTLALDYWKVTIAADTTLDPGGLLPRHAVAVYHVEFLALDERGESASLPRPSVVDLSAELN